MKTPLLLLLVAALAAAGGWWAARSGWGSAAGTAKPAGLERKVLFYQSSMHPWIKSDRPGNCTICGMALTPVYEGDAALSVEVGLVALPSNSVTVLNVQGAEVRRGTLERTLRVAGTLQRDDTRYRLLSAYTAGRLEELFVNYPGAEVRAGQPLARFYSPMLLEAERQYIAVHRSQAAASTPSPEHELLLRAAGQRLRQLGLHEDQIARLPDKDPAEITTEILAPLGGTVVERFVFPGQYVMEGEKLFEVADLSVLWFQFDAYEQDLPWLAPGQEVAVTTSSRPGEVFQAPIRFIDPNLDPMTRSAKVRVELQNPPVRQPDGSMVRPLRHRLYAEGRVQVAFTNLLLVPRSAVLSPDGNALVYLDRGGGAYEQRRVRLGRVGDTDYEVLGGLEEGERVVVNGNLLIDAQAQLNQAIHEGEAHGSGAPGDSTATPPATLEPAAALHVKAFLEAVDAARSALAADQLGAFNAARGRMESAATELRGTLGGPGPWAEVVTRATALAALPEVPGLREARRVFHPLSEAAADLVLAARGASTELADAKVFQCPMTAESFDGAPRRARWIQLGPPLRNPWFGAAMLDCGSEVK